MGVEKSARKDFKKFPVEENHKKVSSSKGGL
jgi:hypothetical protein